MSILAAVKSFLVSNADGSVNLDATADAVKVALAAEIERTAVRDIELGQALDAVYDRLKVDILQTPVAIATAAAFLVGDNLAAMGEVSNELSEYLDRTDRFVGQRGRKGGLKRVSR